MNVGHEALIASIAAANFRSLAVTVLPASWVVNEMFTRFHEIAMSG
jgi:hypothetical protein